MDNFALDSQKTGIERLLPDRTRVIGFVRLFLENLENVWAEGRVGFSGPEGDPITQPRGP